jgi:CRISPR/Cas system-associated endonuclease Cas3-HD
VTLRAPNVINDDQEDNIRAPPRFKWVPVNGNKELNNSVVFAVNPELVAYDEHAGFRFDPEGTSYRTQLHSSQDQKEAIRFSYQLETYQQHIERMLSVYQRISTSELAYPASRLEQRMGWPVGSLERSVRLAIALRDVGKLEQRWQQWVREYQKAIGEPILDDTTMIVHTHFDPTNPNHKYASKSIKIDRPYHSGESSLASARIIYNEVEKTEGLLRAIMTAIAQHHSSHINEAQPFCLHKAAGRAVDMALQKVWLDDWHPTAYELIDHIKMPNLENYLLRTIDHDWRWWTAYFLIVRALRVADGLSQEVKR